MNHPELYARVDANTRHALETFRANHPPQSITLQRMTWEYLVTGQGQETILFLHGMTGAYDIWWQQINALEGRYRIVSVTYPAILIELIEKTHRVRRIGILISRWN